MEGRSCLTPTKRGDGGKCFSCAERVDTNCLKAVLTGDT